MTQFMIIKTGGHLNLPSGVYLRSIDAHEDFLRTVALSYFEDTNNCRLVVDTSGRTEPLVDDVWEAQRSGREIIRTALVVLARKLIDNEIEFVLWCGGDSLDLPIVETWSDFLAQLRSQTKTQPADFYVHYRPSVGHG